VSLFNIRLHVETTLNALRQRRPLLHEFQKVAIGGHAGFLGGDSHIFGGGIRVFKGKWFQFDFVFDFVFDFAATED
jgi:hypothetical protein